MFRLPHIQKVLSRLQHWVQKTFMKGNCCRKRCEGWHRAKIRVWAGSPIRVQREEKCSSFTLGLQFGQTLWHCQGSTYTSHWACTLLPRDKPPNHLLISHITSQTYSNICQTDCRGLLPLAFWQRQLIHKTHGISLQLCSRDICHNSSITVWEVNCFGPAAPSPNNASHLIHRQRHTKRPFGERPTIISLAFREQSSDSTAHAISGRNWRAFLLHLMSLVGIGLQSLRASFHWQLMKNNGQLLYLDFTQGRAFPLIQSEWSSRSGHHKANRK